MTGKLPGKKAMAKRIEQREMGEQYIKTVYNRSHLALKLGPARWHGGEARATVRVHHNAEASRDGVQRNEEIARTVRMPFFTQFVSCAEKRSAGAHRRGYPAFEPPQSHFTAYVRALTRTRLPPSFDLIFAAYYANRAVGEVLHHPSQTRALEQHRSIRENQDLPARSVPGNHLRVMFPSPWSKIEERYTTSCKAANHRSRIIV